MSPVLKVKEDHFFAGMPMTGLVKDLGRTVYCVFFCFLLLKQSVRVGHKKIVPTQGWQAIARFAVHPALQSGTEESLLHQPYPPSSPHASECLEALIRHADSGVQAGTFGAQRTAVPPVTECIDHRCSAELAGKVLLLRLRGHAYRVLESSAGLW